MVHTLPLSVLCGQLLFAGFEGERPSTLLTSALQRGERAGIILFKRNLGDPEARDLTEVAARVRELRALCPADLEPLIGVDQEGGRVARIGPPALQVPPLAALGRLDDAVLVRRVATQQGAELAALGFSINFAPVLDVATNPKNPVIGDRSFGSDSGRVAFLGCAYAEGLETGGVLACGKHFPGHGDTAQDSHFALPVVERDMTSLEAVEFTPFRAAARANIAALMTAHVVFSAVDSLPATLSRRFCTHLLRETWGYGGLLVSDDLEMKAIAAQMSTGDAACAAVEAGCDLLLICSKEAEQAAAHEALVRRAESDPAFFERCAQAARRVGAARLRARGLTKPSIVPGQIGLGHAERISHELQERLAAPVRP
jgi:beta-N-acetylhexosaminidase